MTRLEKKMVALLKRLIKRSEKRAQDPRYERSVEGQRDYQLAVKLVKEAENK